MDIAKMTNKALKAKATELGISFGEDSTRDEIIAAINAVQPPEAAPEADPNAPKAFVEEDTPPVRPAPVASTKIATCIMELANRSVIVDGKTYTFLANGICWLNEKPTKDLIEKFKQLAIEG